MGRAFEYRRAAKEKRWDKMSKVFPKLAKAITVAAKSGGVDPDSNSALRTAILNAKSENMPKHNIEAAIKRASGKDALDLKELNYEGKANHGVLIFIECATDNPTRTIANVKAIFNKHNGSIVPTGSLEFMFDRKAIFEVQRGEETDVEEVELELIDAGLEEIELEEKSLKIYGDYTSFKTLGEAIEKMGLETIKANLQRIPNSPVELSEAQLEEVEIIIDKLEDDEDVQAVYTNIM